MSFLKTIPVAVLILSLFGCGSSKEATVEAVDVRYNRGIEYFEKGKYEKAIEEFTFVTYNAPGGEFGDDAQLHLGESHFKLKEYILAISEYERLMRVHPESPLVENAEYMRAKCYDLLSPGYAHDQEYTTKAITAYQEFIEDWPLSEFKEEAQGRLDDLRFKLARKMFESGKQYKKLSEYESCIIYMRQLVEQFYDSEFAPKARWMIAQCEIKLKRWDDALATIQNILQRDDDPETVESARNALPGVKRKSEELRLKSSAASSLDVPGE